MQQPLSAPEILKAEDPELHGVPLDPAIAEATRKRFLRDTEPFGNSTPKGMLRARALRRTHGKREGETECINQLNPMFLRQLLESEYFQAFHGTGNGGPPTPHGRAL